MANTQSITSEQKTTGQKAVSTGAKAVGTKASSGVANSMRQIRIAKVTLNIGAGKSEEHLKKGVKLLETLGAPIKPVKTVTQKRIPGWGLRPGLAIGCMVTVRREMAEKLLKRLLFAKGNRLPASCFDTQGSFSFGIPEYIEIEGMEYDPELKIMGLEVAVTLDRPGYRVKVRKIRPTPVGLGHRVTKEEAAVFIADRFHVEVF